MSVSYRRGGSKEDKKAYMIAVLEDEAVCQALKSLACARLFQNVKAQIKKKLRGLVGDQHMDRLAKHEFGSAGGIVAFIGRRRMEAAEKAASAEAAGVVEDAADAEAEGSSAEAAAEEAATDEAAVEEAAVEEAAVEEAAVEEAAEEAAVEEAADAERHTFELLAERLGVRFEPPAPKDDYRIPRCGGSGSAAAAGKAVADDERAVEEEAAPLLVVRLWKLRQAERSVDANAERHRGMLQRLRRRRNEAPKLSRKLVQLTEAASVSCKHAAVR
jgi:hypothetical protein